MKRRLPAWQKELQAIRHDLREIREVIAGNLAAPLHIYPTFAGEPKHVFKLDKCWCSPEVRWDGEWPIVVHRRTQ